MTIQFPNKAFCDAFAWNEAQQGKYVKVQRLNGIWQVEIK